jgi:hypothetical protein
MNGDQINRVAKDVHRITVAAGMRLSEASEMYLRLVGSVALAAHGQDREKAASQLEAWAKQTADALRDPATKLRRPSEKRKR